MEDDIRYYQLFWKSDGTRCLFGPIRSDQSGMQMVCDMMNAMIEERKDDAICSLVEVFPVLDALDKLNH